MAKNKYTKKIKCPLCDERFTSIEGLYDHIEEEHDDEIPDGFTPARYMYYIKTGKMSGSCVIDKKPTEWNESTGKYHRFCNNPKCKERYREIFKNRMINKYGKVNLLKDPEQQKKMLAHRKISGEYKWTDGTKITYTGSYEKEFLQFLDVFMNFESSDIMGPSPHTYYYKYNGEELFYIPDFYIPSLKLEVEIKDGGNNPNMHSKIQAVDKVKERLKDEVMNAQKEYDYIKIVNKNYDNFFEYLLQKKEDFIRDNEDVVVTEPVHESHVDMLEEGLFDFKNRRMYYISKNKNEKFNSSTVFTKDIKQALYWFMKYDAIKYKEVKDSQYKSWFEDTTELIIDNKYENELNKNVFIYSVNRSAFDSDIRYGARIKNNDKFKILNIKEIKLIDVIRQEGIKVTINTMSSAEISNRKRLVMALRNRFQLTLNKPEYIKFKNTKALSLDLSSTDIADFVNGNSDSISYIRYDLNKFYDNKARYYMNEDSAKEYHNLINMFIKDILMDKLLSNISIHNDGDWDNGGYSAMINYKKSNGINTKALSEANLYGFITRQDISKSKIHSPKDLNDILNTYQYGILTKDKQVITDELTGDEFFELYKTISVEDFETYKVGLSADYVVYQEYYFKKYFDYEYKLFYLELDNETSSSHNFMVYFADGKCYYFESAYKKYQGITEFDDIESLFNHVLNNMFSDNGKECDFIIYEYKNMPTGLSRVGFEDMLLAFGREVPHTYNKK